MRKVFLLFAIILFEETVDGRLCRLVTRYGRKWTWEDTSCDCKYYL